MCLLHGIVLNGTTDGLNREMKLKGDLDMFWRTVLEGSWVQGKRLCFQKVQLATNFFKLVPKYPLRMHSNFTNNWVVANLVATRILLQ